MRRYFIEKFKSLKKFGKNIIDQCRRDGYLTSFSGRRRVFPNINSTIKGLKAQSERQAVNFCIQVSFNKIECEICGMKVRKLIEPY